MYHVQLYQTQCLSDNDFLKNKNKKKETLYQHIRCNKN